MKTNVLPAYDYEDNPTGCCAHFHPEGWDNQTLHLDNKKFVRATTHSLFHIPLDMGKVFQKTFEFAFQGVFCLSNGQSLEIYSSYLR